MKRLALLLPTCLLVFCSVSHALDPPVKLWEKWYYQEWDGAFFRDVELTNSGNLFITGSAYDWTVPILDYYSAFLLDLDGNVIWEVEQPWYVGKGNDGEVLPDGSYVITGRCVEDPDSTYSLFIMKIDQAGSIEWTRVYDYPITREEGFGITCLPDGGYAVCGRVNGTGLWEGQAWILRTDANGDTLWTDIWGEHTINFAKGIAYDPANNWIVACTYGRSDTLINRGPHLLYYSLDGEFLQGTTYPDLYPEQVRGFCRSADGGYVFLSRYGTGESVGTLTHTNALGEIQWSQPVVPIQENDNLGLGFAQFDGGYICCGWDGYWGGPPGDPFSIDTQMSQSTKDGWLVRFDADGNELWNIRNEIGGNNHFYSVVQLPQGGYMAAGSSGGGYLVRYAPETGIEEPELSTVTSLDIAPNPFSSSLSITFNLPEAAPVRLSLFDLSGRLVQDLVSGAVAGGAHSVTWSPASSIPDGCYLIVLDACGERAVRRCLKL